MLIYGLMKYIEKIPVRYDKMMNILTFGNHSRSHKILLSYVKPGMRVLDIGCGTGDFSLKCAGLGAAVTCVDASIEMLRVLKNKIAEKTAGNNIRIIECGSASVKEMLKQEKFDLIVMSMMLGELPEIVRKKTMRSASELLAPGGAILINDELWPKNKLLSLIYHFLFWIFFIPNFILTRTLIRPVKDLDADIKECSLEAAETKTLFFGVITILKLVRRS